MLDGKKLGNEISEALALRDEKTIRHWQNIAITVCKHIIKNAEVMEGITVSTPAGSAVTTGKGKIQ